MSVEFRRRRLGKSTRLTPPLRFPADGSLIPVIPPESRAAWASSWIGGDANSTQAPVISCWLVPKVDGASRVLTVLRDLAAEGRTMLLVTHEMGLARDIADQVLFFDAGKVAESGPPEQVFGDPLHPRTREFLRGAHR